MDAHANSTPVPQANTNTVAEKLANIADYLHSLVEALQSTPERHGPIHHFFSPPEKRSFLYDNDHDLWVDDGEECFICKEPRINQPEPCIGDPPRQPDDKCHPIHLWPCDHVVGDQCFKLWMSNSVNSDAGLCPYCRQPLMVAAQPQSVMERGVRRVTGYLSSSQMSAVPDLVVNDLRELRIQLTTQPLSALQPSELRGPLQNLALMLYWSSCAFGGPLATIFSGLPVMDKVGAVLNIDLP